jgi:glycosyltransferase involved in cell wall biosynthesis
MNSISDPREKREDYQKSLDLSDCQGWSGVTKTSLPLVTIITVVFNGDKHLQCAIDSVRSQSYEHIEYLVIDGGSTDRTLDILKKNELIITHWLSEPDTGIYNAMNKGLALANGTYIGFLNADDVLLPDCVERAVCGLESLGTPGYTCAAVDLIDESGRKYGITIPFDEQTRLQRRFLEMPCAHQGIFVHKKVYEKVGGFDESFRLSADYDFFLRLINSNIACVTLTTPIAQFRKGGVSGGWKTWLDTFNVHRKHRLHLASALYSLGRSITKASFSFLAPAVLRRNIRYFLKSQNHYHR